MKSILLALLAIAAAVAQAAVTSGPAAGSAPMLTIDPANVDGAPYCVTCEAGTEPAVVAFLTRDDGPTRALLAQLSEQAKAHEAAKLHVTAIILGDAHTAHGLLTYAGEHRLRVPIARVDRRSEDLKPWAINAEATNTVVLFQQHKVVRSLANLSADKLGEHVAQLVAAGGETRPHH